MNLNQNINGHARNADFGSFLAGSLTPIDTYQVDESLRALDEIPCMVFEKNTPEYEIDNTIRAWNQFFESFPEDCIGCYVKKLGKSEGNRVYYVYGNTAFLECYKASIIEVCNSNLLVDDNANTDFNSKCFDVNALLSDIEKGDLECEFIELGLPD